MIAVPYIWLLILFLIPFAIVLKISFAEQRIAIPPFTPLTTIDEDLGRLNIAISYQNYADIFPKLFGIRSIRLATVKQQYLSDDLLVLRLKTALTTTIICLLIGYPTAYAISRANPACAQRPAVGNHAAFLDLFSLLRVYAWMGLLGQWYSSTIS